MFVRLVMFSSTWFGQNRAFVGISMGSNYRDVKCNRVMTAS